MSHRFDATLKDIVAQRPGDFTDVFDLPKIAPAVALNIDLSTLSAATDVAVGYGKPLQEIVDLNFQSGPDAGLAGRLHHYNASLHARHNVSVESIVVLLRPKADAANLTGKLAYGRLGRRLEFEYGVVRLWQEPVDSFLRSGAAALPLATLCQMPEGKTLPEALRDVVREIDRRLGKEANHAEAVRLMTAAYILTGLRVPKGDLASIYRGVGLMQESTAFDEVMDEGIARGRIEGEARGKIRVLLRLGRKQIGEIDPATESELNAIRDLDRLDRLVDAVLTAETWNELLATP